MVFARIVWWKIKPGMRDEVLNRMNQMKGELQATKGYRGVAILKSLNNPDRITNIAFWDSEDSLKASEGTILKKVADSMADLIDGPPQIANQEVAIFDMAKILA